MGKGLVLVKGGGEVGTAVALALWQVGWRVVVCELARPTVLRRQLSLAEAAFAGRVVREGVSVERVAEPRAAAALLETRSALPLYVGPLDAALAALTPDVTLDARMRRLVLVEDQRGEAPLVVGLGPGCHAGRNVDVVVETNPGPMLGQVLWRGAALPHVSRQRPPDEAVAERYAYAARAGRWQTPRAIGETVAAGEALGTLDGLPVYAPVGGCLRGLVHDDVPIGAGAKLAAIHPGDWQRKEAGIGCRAADIAAAVLGLLDTVPPREPALEAAASRSSRAPATPAARPVWRDLAVPVALGLSAPGGANGG